MKPVRGLVVGILVVAMLLLAAVGLACTSTFQTWAARRALASQPDLDVTLGRVSAGLNRVNLDNVRYVREGAVLTLPTAEAELPLFAAAFRHQILIRRLQAHGWTLDLTQARMAAPAATAAATRAHGTDFSLLPSAFADVAAAVPPVVFAGIFHQLRLPVDVALGNVDLAGDVLLPAMPGRPPAKAKVTITGGNLAAGHPGKFDYTAVIHFDGDAGPVRELRVTGNLGVVMDTPRTITRFVAATEAEATGPTFPAGVKLSVDLTAAQTVAGESYAVAVLSGTKQLAAVETIYAAGQSHLRGTWRIDMHDTDLAAFVLGRELPVFEASGEGRFDVDATFAELNASGRLNAVADRLATVKPELGSLGALKLAADFDVAQRGDATRVDRLTLTLTGAKPVATVQALQAFEFNPRTGELNVADPSKELLGVSFQSLPVAWIQPLLRKSGWITTGDEVRGELAASARNGGFALRCKAPLSIGGLSVALADGRPLLRDVDVSLTVSADYAPQGWQVAFEPLAVSSHGSPVFALELKAGQLAGKGQPVKLAGELTAQLPQLFAQPAIGFTGLLSKGEAQADFVASLDSKREVQVRLTLNRLAASDGAALPSLATDLRIDLEADGKMAFNVPLRFDRDGRKSDLTLSGTTAPAAKSQSVNVRLTSDALVIDDVKAFAVPLMNLPAAPRPPRGDRTGPALPAPFWFGFEGSGTVAVKKVTYNDAVEFHDVGGTLRLEPDALKLTDVKGGFGPDSTMRLGGSLTHRGTKTAQYGLTADLALDNFDLTAAFLALNPSQPPRVQGRVNLSSHLTGTGTTMAEVADHTQGEVRVTGKSGIFRVLAVDMSGIQKASTLVSIAGMLGVVNDDYLNKAQIFTDIAKALAEIPYDQLSLVAVRGEDLDFHIKEFTLISPEVRLGGTGTVKHVPGVSILEQPLEMQFNVGARGKTGELMKRALVLDEHPDSLGYAGFSGPLKLGGTLAKPDASAIRRALLNSALERGK